MFQWAKEPLFKDVKFAEYDPKKDDDLKENVTVESFIEM